MLGSALRGADCTSGRRRGTSGARQVGWRDRVCMDARVFDKSKLPSRHVTEGPARAPHRSYYYAMGLSREQIHQPFVGVATCWNEAAPCNIALMRQAQAVKQGVSAANGTPREFCTITVTDGIAMGHQGMKSSLPSREVIADSVELTMRGHCYDALIGMAGCDKSLPGMMMAMCRLNVPSIFIYGGTILPGSFKGRAVTVQDLFEAVGQYSVGKMTAEDLDQLEVLHGLGHVAQVAGHALAREHAARVLRHRDRARHVVRTAVAVRRALRAEVVALDGAGVALTDGRALYVDQLARGEQRHRNGRASLILGGDVGFDAEFLEDFTGFDTCLGEVTGFRLGHARSFARTERHLDGAVAVGLLGLDLGHAVVGHVQHRHRDGIAIVREDAHHAHLAAQQTETVAQTHVFAPMPHIDWRG